MFKALPEAPAIKHYGPELICSKIPTEGLGPITTRYRFAKASNILTGSSSSCQNPITLPHLMPSRGVLSAVRRRCSRGDLATITASLREHRHILRFGFASSTGLPDLPLLPISPC